MSWLLLRLVISMHGLNMKFEYLKHINYNATEANVYRIQTLSLFQFAFLLWTIGVLAHEKDIATVKQFWIYMCLCINSLDNSDGVVKKLRTVQWCRESYILGWSKTSLFFIEYPLPLGTIHSPIQWAMETLFSGDEAAWVWSDSAEIKNDRGCVSTPFQTSLH